MRVFVHAGRGCLRSNGNRDTKGGCDQGGSNFHLNFSWFVSAALGRGELFHAWYPTTTGYAIWEQDLSVARFDSAVIASAKTKGRFGFRIAVSKRSAALAFLNPKRIVNGESKIVQGDTAELEAARLEMVARQIRDRGIRDERVLNAMRAVPRHLFVPAEFVSRAYSDEPLPIGEGQTISQPFMVAAMAEALSLQGHERVLEIGGGSGYQAAILSQLALEVIAIEARPVLAVAACGAHRSVGVSQCRA